MNETKHQLIKAIIQDLRRRQEAYYAISLTYIFHNTKGELLKGIVLSRN